MDTQFKFRPLSNLQAVPLFRTCRTSLALLLIGTLGMTTPAIAQNVESVLGDRYVDRANCFAGASSIDIAICLKEVNAALAAVQQEKPIDLGAHFQKSVSLQCQVPLPASHAACKKQMRGDGTDSTKVKDTRVVLDLAVQT